MNRIKLNPYSCIALALCLAAGACSKTGLSIGSVAGKWNLVEKNGDFGPNNFDFKPAPDSAVVLDLGVNALYTSYLNGKAISQGPYAVRTGTGSYAQTYLQLNGFKTTGIFSLFYLYEIGSNGQVLSTFDGLTIRLSGDSLFLNTPPTPDGMTIYTFVKQ